MRLPGVGEHAPEPAGRRDERRGLAVDGLHVRVLGLKIQAPGHADLPDLAVAHRGDGSGQELRDLGAEVGRDLRGPGEQVVAGEDGDRVVPPGVRAGPASPEVGLVDDVVVIQRGEVGELDGHGSGHEPGVGRVAEVPGQEHEHGAEPLAAGLDEVRRRLGQEVEVGPDGLLQGLLDPVEAGAQLGLERGVGRLQPRDPRPRHRFIVVGRVTIGAPTPSAGSR